MSLTDHVQTCHGPIKPASLFKGTKGGSAAGDSASYRRLDFAALTNTPSPGDVS